ncbi:hypothetical protein PIB30_097391 [Stylosanthes scabra]|uniref:Uncharacterized protein n=1 Tax=Stylosanthes scabra TaxID=79078 RepID=A0ABU6SWR7_9FABA|nr:hypothetical protein [Stylosanthes scabra]
MEEFGYPPTLYRLIESNLLFKINVKLNNIEQGDRVYTLLNIRQDEEFVKQYLPEDFISQQTATITKMDGSNSPEESQAVVNLHTDVDDPNALAAREESVSTKTLGKRPMKEIKSGPNGSFEYDVEGQLSTIKFSTRGGKKGRLSAIHGDN